LMLTDVLSSVGGQVQSTAAQHPVGIVMGKGQGMALLTYLSGDADLKPGDRVTTSGLGAVFPADVPIGTVRTVQLDKARSMKTAWIRPSADLDHLDEAFIEQK
jgi:cell shape-determining protein MreC